MELLSLGREEHGRLVCRKGRVVSVHYNGNSGGGGDGVVLRGREGRTERLLLLLLVVVVVVFRQSKRCQNLLAPSQIFPCTSPPWFLSCLRVVT